jgi:hypothetical protein
MKNLLLGDSIHMGYDSFVRDKPAGRANVFFHEGGALLADEIIGFLMTEGLI